MVNLTSLTACYGLVLTVNFVGPIRVFESWAGFTTDHQFTFTGTLIGYLVLLLLPSLKLGNFQEIAMDSSHE